MPVYVYSVVSALVIIQFFDKEPVLVLHFVNKSDPIRLFTSLRRFHIASSTPKAAPSSILGHCLHAGKHFFPLFQVLSTG